MYKTSNFRPNYFGHVSKKIGYDVTGRPTFSERVRIGLSVVNLDADIEQTSIRADKSASKSRAQEQVRTGRILVEPTASVSMGDMLELAGERWKIDRKAIRLDQAGRIHHFQVDIVSWA